MKTIEQRAETNTLHLVLKKKWYDMIASGEKKEEYRTGNYWQKRLLVEPPHVNSLCELVLKFKPFTKVVFHLGYTNTTMTFKIAGFDFDNGKEEWGAIPYHTYYIIKLGDKL